MSLLGDLLVSARAAIRQAFAPAPPAAAVVACVKCDKSLNAIVRHGDKVFKHDSAGNIKAVKVGAPYGVGHGGAPGETFIAQKFELELQNGTKVEALKSLGRWDATTQKIVRDGRMDADCHGVTFANGEYWINNDQVDAMLNGGGFKLAKTAKPGDVLVYRDVHGEVVHSVTVSQVDAAGRPLQVSGLGGIEMKEHFDDPSVAWFDPSASREIYSP